VLTKTEFIIIQLERDDNQEDSESIHTHERNEEHFTQWFSILIGPHILI
jgi:hypothetical protein